MPNDKLRKRVVVEEVIEEFAPEIKEELNTETKTETPEVVTESPVDERPVDESPEEDTQVVETITETAESNHHEHTNIDQNEEQESHHHSDEPLNDTEPTQIPEIRNSSGTNPLFIIVPGIFLLGALLGGIYFYQSSLNNQDGLGLSGSLNQSPVPTEVVVSAQPSASPSVSVDISKYPVNILNGSGIVGEAGKVKTLLTGAGFSVSATGNASSYDFTKTIVKAKADVPEAFIAQLTAALSKSYILDTAQVLATSSADSVQVIVGSTKAK